MNLSFPCQHLIGHTQQKKFSNLGSTINSRFDEMGTRVDDLERSINELMDSSGLSEQHADTTTPSSGARKNEDEK